MSDKGPGKANRIGISIIELFEMFPDENSAKVWFEEQRWPNGERHCPRCGSTRTHEATHKNSPYRCSDCRAYFSVKVGTIMEKSQIPLRKWAIAIYLETTSLKGVSSMKLHRDLKITQKSAWFMLHRIREAWHSDQSNLFEGPIEVDETFIGGKEKNKHSSKKHKAGRGGVGKTIVVGAKDRLTNQVIAKVIETADKPTLHDFVEGNTNNTAMVYTDEAKAYRGINRNHEAVNHSVGQYVDEMAHTNGMESFWSQLKRAYHGVYHHISPKHLQRYVNQFAGRHNIREHDTIEMMRLLTLGMFGKRLSYKQLIA